MGYIKLQNHLIDVIKENQAKLGFQKEKLRLYYPLSSLNHFFDTQDQAEEMQKRLNHLPSFLTDKLGKIEVTHKKDQFCFLVSEEGSVYVHENTKENEFIKKLIDLVREHGCTMEEIKALFYAYSDQVVMEETDHGEFDYLIYFKECEEDPYYYCFKDEGCHITYHRFLPEDYKDFNF